MTLSLTKKDFKAIWGDPEAILNESRKELKKTDLEQINQHNPYEVQRRRYQNAIVEYLTKSSSRREIDAAFGLDIYRTLAKYNIPRRDALDKMDSKERKSLYKFINNL